MPKVTARQAEDIRAAIEKRFSAYVHDGQYGRPTLYDHTHENLSAGSWVIVWEEGPYEWALAPFDNFVDDESFFLATDAGLTVAQARTVASKKASPQPHADRVFLEPIHSFTLGLYPA